MFLGRFVRHVQYMQPVPRIELAFMSAVSLFGEFAGCTCNFKNLQTKSCIFAQYMQNLQCDNHDPAAEAHERVGSAFQDGSVSHDQNLALVRERAWALAVSVPSRKCCNAELIDCAVLACGPAKGTVCLGYQQRSMLIMLPPAKRENPLISCELLCFEVSGMCVGKSC